MAAASKAKNEEISQSEEEESRNIGECPVCSETRTNTRYYSCQKGHSICGVCKAETSKCGICQGGFSDPPARNLAVEQYIQANPALPCKNKSYGCSYVGTFTQRLGHENDSCVYTPAPCPAPTCSQMVAVLNMNKHIQKVHNNEWIFINMDSINIWDNDYDSDEESFNKRNRRNYKYNKGNSSFRSLFFKQIRERKTPDYWTSQLELRVKSNRPTPIKFEFSLIHIQHEKEDFYLIVEHDPEIGCANFYFYVRGSEKLSRRFTGHVITSSKCRYSHSISYTSKVFNLWTDRTDILKSPDSLTLTQKQISQFADEYDDGGIRLNMNIVIR